MWEELFKKALPQDFMKFGLIPEFVGRVPVTVSLDLLNKDAMVRIRPSRKNSLVKQYKSCLNLTVWNWSLSGRDRGDRGKDHGT